MKDHGLTDKKEPQLTREAKEGIRNYMLKIVALPGIVATLVAFLLGLFIRDIAFKEAQLEAAQKLEPALTNALAKSQAAEEKLKDADALTAKIQNLQGLATTLTDRDKLRDELARQLKADPGFIAQLSNTYVPFGAEVVLKSKQYPKRAVTSLGESSNVPYIVGGALKPEGPTDYQKWIVENAVSK